MYILIQILTRVKNKVTSIAKDVKVKKYLRQWKNHEHNTNEKIKVAFIFQMPEIWDKLSPVYELMKQNKRFETTLLLVPAYDLKNDQVASYGEEKEFVYQKYPSDNIVDAIDDSGNVVDIADYKFDYVFYQRPYENYLPKELRTEALVKYTKVCYVPYSYSCASAFNSENTNKDFFRNVYLNFADSMNIHKALSACFKENIKQKIQKFLYVGYPVFDTYLDMRSEEKTGGILWTPRWSFDPRIGGSHFVDYKDEFLALSNELPNEKIIIRPHPLMWENVVKVGLMKENEVIEYKEKLKSHNILIDSNKMMEDTIKESNVLITDFSSIIITYFMTGKPIIYCPFETELNEMYQKLLSGMYIANCWDDVEKYLDMIYKGEDILYSVRQEIIEKELMPLAGGTQRIVEEILADFNE